MIECQSATKVEFICLSSKLFMKKFFNIIWPDKEMANTYLCRKRTSWGKW